jgi:hypothetical protein
MNAFFVRSLRWGLIIVLVASIPEYLRFLNLQRDTVDLIHEVQRILSCLSQGKWIGWGGHFPLLQKIPVLLLEFMGLPEQTILEWLAILSLIAFANLVAWSWKDLRKTSRNLAVFFVAILVSGPLLWYARSSFGEMLAAFFTLGFVISCRENSNAFKIFVFFILAGISKDTAFPFLLIFGLLASSLDLTDPREVRFRRPRWVLIAMGCVTTASINMGFNYLKVGSVFNLPMLNPQLIVQTWKDQLSFFVGIWFSPNGGVLFFWPSLCLLIFLVVREVTKNVFSKGDDTRYKVKAFLPFGVVMSVLLGLTFGFSKWFSPMGWACWGPRLLLPWLPAAGYLLVTAYSRQINEWASYVCQKGRRFWTLSFAWVLVSFGQFIILFRPSLMDPLFFIPDDTCPKVAYITKDPVYYYHCANHLLWTKNPVLLDAYSPGLGPTAFIFSIAWCICLIWFLGFARKERSQDETVRCYSLLQ